MVPVCLHVGGNGENAILCHIPNHQALRMFPNVYIREAIFLLQLVEVFCTSQKTILLDIDFFFFNFEKETKRNVGFAVIFLNLAKVGRGKLAFIDGQIY